MFVTSCKDKKNQFKLVSLSHYNYLVIQSVLIMIKLYENGGIDLFRRLYSIFASININKFFVK